MRAIFRQCVVTLRQPPRRMPVCWLGSLRSACTSLRFSSRNLSVVSFHGGSPQVASAFGSTKSPEGRGSLQVASTHRSAGSPGGSGPEKEYRRRGASSMSSSELSNRMVWVDLEMTGLDIEKDQIIEMACVITDAELNVVAEGPNLVIKQPDQLLDGMSDWCKEHHGQVTLFMRTRSSWINTCLSSCSTSTIESSTSAPSRSSADGGSLKSTRWFLRRRPATEPWMTSRRASRSCSTTEPSSSKKPCSTEWVLQKIPEAKGTGRHKSTSAHLPHVSGAEDSLKDHHDATQPSIPLNPLDNLVRATGLWMFRQHQQQKT